MEKIKTASGKQFDCSSFSAMTNPDRAYIRIVGSSIAEIASVFSDPNETVQLWYDEAYLSQFTNLVAIVPEPGMVRVVLSR